MQGRLELESIYKTVQVVLLRCLQSYPCNAHEISELQITKQFRLIWISLIFGLNIWDNLNINGNGE